MFNDTNPFDPIKLHGAISNPSSYSESQHGKLTAIIRYYLTPPKDYPPGTDPPLLTVALGNDVEVNTIYGWPTWQSLGLNLLTTDGVFSSRFLQREFDIFRQETTKGFQNNVNWELDEFLRSSEFATMRTKLQAPPAIVSSDSTHKGYLERTLCLKH